MFYAYVAKSLNYDFLYKGHCENLEKRLKQHNSGMTVSIRKFIPFKVVYSEEFNTEKEAILREKYLRQRQAAGFSRQKYNEWPRSSMPARPNLH